MNAHLETQARELLRRVGALPYPLHDDLYVAVSNAAIEAAAVIGMHRDDEDVPITGWMIVSMAEAPEAANFAYYSVREIEAQRPEWLVGLHLPIGWAFRIDGNTLVDCVTGKRTTIPVNTKIEVT
jgi:hypothetical protein